MKRKKTIWAAVWAALLLAVFAATVLWINPGRRYTLNLPAPEKLESIVLAQGEQSSTVSSRDRMNTLLNILTGPGRTTKGESIQDSPVNAENIFQIDFHFIGQGASTLFVYERKGKFYIEQPYNGIYTISAGEFDSIGEYMK